VFEFFKKYLQSNSELPKVVKKYGTERKKAHGMNLN